MAEPQNKAAADFYDWLTAFASEMPLTARATRRVFDEALAIERRNTVERIVQRWHDGDQWRDGGSHPNSSIQKCGTCSQVLDEEAPPT